MANCINKNTPGYQTLKEKSGVSELLLDSVCDIFIEKYGRLPYLDEIPGSNSENHLKKGIKLKEDNSTTIKDILDFTNTNDIKQATIDINQNYTDKEVTILPIANKAIVDITSRPTDAYARLSDFVDIDLDLNSAVFLNKMLNKLSNLYGIEMETVTDKELASEKWKNLIPLDRIVNAFVYEGKIYINTDRASLDSPIHEMMHLLIGGLRFTNYSLYQNLINMAESFESYEGLAIDYLGKTRNDVNEEVFVQEVAKYLSGLDSVLSNADEKIIYEIDRSIKRVLDTLLMGETSSKTISNRRLYNLSLKDIAKAVRASTMLNTYKGACDDPTLHRMLNNKKSELLKSGILEEICD